MLFWKIAPMELKPLLTANMTPVGITTTNPEEKLLEKGAKMVVEKLDEINLSILYDLIKSG